MAPRSLPARGPGALNHKPAQSSCAVIPGRPHTYRGARSSVLTANCARSGPVGRGNDTTELSGIEGN